MHRAILVAVAVIVAGCTSPVDTTDDGPPDGDGFGLRAARIDTDGDGRVDALNLTLLATTSPIGAEELVIERDGEPVDVEPANATAWAPGESRRVACPEGVHEFRVFVRGELKRVLVEECGVPPPRVPPFFQSTVTDGDDDGLEDVIELEVTSGGPVAVGTLSARLDDEAVRIYADPLKSDLAEGSIANGSRVYTPCHPDVDRLNLTWDGRALPSLAVRGCQAYEPGLDAPTTFEALDVDGDGEQDGWRVTLGQTEDGPFPMSEVNASWNGTPAPVNASSTLDPPPPTWSANTSLVAVCPVDDELRFDLRIDGALIARRFTPCEAAPGDPLIDLSLNATGEGELEATLVFSRLGPLRLDNVTTAEGKPVGEGRWQAGSTVRLACPGGELVLRVEDRLAFRGPAPC